MVIRMETVAPLARHNNVLLKREYIEGKGTKEVSSPAIWKAIAATGWPWLSRGRGFI